MVQLLIDHTVLCIIMYVPFFCTSICSSFSGFLSSVRLRSVREVMNSLLLFISVGKTGVADWKLIVCNNKLTEHLLQ